MILSSLVRWQVEGNTVKIRKDPGWLFGDVALLFNSQRSASVVAATDITLWALNGRFFSKVTACIQTLNLGARFKERGCRS